VRPFLGTSIQDYIGGKAAANALKYQNLANARVAERVVLEEQAMKSGKETRRDVYHHLIHARDPEAGKGFTKEELQADSALLIAAGSDGVAATIAACIFYLLRNPSAYAKLTTEIRSSFASAEEIRTPKLNSLPYLLACI
jgi:cytochrome P450